MQLLVLQHLALQQRTHPTLQQSHCAGNVQMLLSLSSGHKELARWPQYEGRLVVDASGRCQIHLDVFEYFIFWTAFYVLRSSQSQARQPGRRNNTGGYASGGLVAVSQARGFLETQSRRPCSRLVSSRLIGPPPATLLQCHAHSWGRHQAE